MNIVCIGLNWKTPITVRERIAFDTAAQQAGLNELRGRHASAEFAILSTCNRTEVYAGQLNETKPIAADELAGFLSDARDVSIDEFFPHLYRHQGRDAAEHLFEVASGLDSLVLGEAQILGQAKQAYQAAVEAGVAGPLLHAVFQKAFNVAKRIQTETALSKGRLSIASAAVDYVQGVFETFRDKCVLIIGAGKMAELTATHLRDLHPERVLVTNRSPERAEHLAQRFAGQAWSFDKLDEALVQADIVISSTAADEPIMRLGQFSEIMKQRRQRLIAIVDIALPRDFDIGIAELPNVLLWNIDDLEKVRHETVHARRSELNAAQDIVRDELSRFDNMIASIKSGPIISQLDREYQRIIDDELDWLLPQLNGIDPSQQEKIRHFAHRLKNKLLHPPKRALRDHTREGNHGLLEAVQRLFGLERDDD